QYNPGNSENNSLTFNLISQQIQLLGKQIAMLQNGNSPQGLESMHSPVQSPTVNTDNKTRIVPTANADTRTDAEKLEHKKPFGASPKIDNNTSDLGSAQRDYMNQLIDRYTKKTASSKSYAQKHRKQMADPRVVSGFKPLTKEMVYPLVIEKSSGNRLWDIDGNEYIDALNGFGSCFFGHQPEFIKEALHDQIEHGFEVGPQHPLAGEVCELLCEFTGHDRAALCNTGSEAVLGAMRIARTVTGRSLIVAFTGAYHGINDEALVRGSQKKKTFPAAAGIQPEAVQNMLILDYGTQESLEIIRDRADELAAVLVEPVQSRRPEFQPVEFLKELREITTDSGTAFIFDEVITGFRMHPGGAQALFGIVADLATYGKVMGGGLSIGAIIGKRKFMDALDGGFWQYGDTSYPEVGVTYFAGTFVRHPLALAASKASLTYMKEKGKGLQQGLNARTATLAADLNEIFQKRSLPLQINYFGSLWRLKFNEEIPFGELLFVLLRERGIHIWDGFPCFLTTSYNDEDIEKLKTDFAESCDELIHAGIFPASAASAEGQSFKVNSKTLNTPPVPGAKLGRDEQGNPAWYLPSADDEQEYIKFEL
ncbi:MAG: aminotransferase class III-fold pyridoxal phosphate-dependent enzyme, partial [Leeuwenhoekiella sp.]